jgi:alpha-beta hydrolase superfamily lysophospholipase
MQPLEQNTGYFKMSDGFNIFYRKWPSSSGQIDRVVLFLHGIEVHSGAFSFMGPELASEGSEVYGFDRRGFGNSKEIDLPRGDTHGFDRHLEDLNEVVEFMHKSYPGKKLFIFGHSIGSAYALRFVANYPQQFDGLILAAPPLEAGFKIPVGDTLKVALAPHIGHHSMYNLIDEWPKAFRESEEYKLISEDPLCTKEFGLGFLFNIQTKLANKMLDNASKVEKPVFLMHGDSDIVALPNSSYRIREKLASNDKTLQVFPRADHWFYQSIIPKMSTKYSLEQKKEVSCAVKNWLEKQSSTKEVKQ